VQPQLALNPFPLFHPARTNNPKFSKTGGDLIIPNGRKTANWVNLQGWRLGSPTPATEANTLQMIAPRSFEPFN
jgi:hypothetical protein